MRQLISGVHRVVTVSGAALLFSVSHVALVKAQTTERVSVDSNERPVWLASLRSAISGDGNIVVFASPAKLLDRGDTNGRADVFARNRAAGTTRRVTVSSGGLQSNADTFFADVSSNGRFVTFSTHASTLVPGDTNGETDVFVHDRRSGTTQRMSVSSGGSEGNGSSASGVISGSGRYVAFHSFASNLAPGDSNFVSDVFVRDRDTGVTKRVSVTSSGQQSAHSSSDAAISQNGRYIAFTAFGDDLVPGDTNGQSDILVHDRVTGTTERISVNSREIQSNGPSFEASLSADGRFVAFNSSASNLVNNDTNGVSDCFVRDRTNGATERVSVASGGVQSVGSSNSCQVSGNGRYVAFVSISNDFVPGDTNGAADVFIHDWETDVTRRASVSFDGTQANGDSREPDISFDGRYVSFQSDASNLVPGDGNGHTDVFVRDLGPD